MYIVFNDYFDYLCPGIVDTYFPITGISLPEKGRGRKEVFEVVKN